MPGRDVTPLFAYLDSRISDVVACIDRSGPVSLALIVDENRRLLSTVTDGDVRRALLAGCRLSDPVTLLLERKGVNPDHVPVTAPATSDSQTLVQLMNERHVRQLPLLDSEGRVVKVVILSDFLPQPAKPMRAMVMAGGFGMRLRPLTDDIPKPMLPVGDRPLMEHIIGQLREVGVRNIHVTTHYRPDKIMSHFGSGESFGVNIEYVNEQTPLGTGGALGLIEPSKEPLLVINGDILTQVDFRSMYAFHQEHGADMTVGIRHYEMQVPYGVVDCDGARISGLREKPGLSFFVNAGIYLLEPTVFRYVREGAHMNMTDLIHTLLDHGRSVISFPICEYWLDMGQHADYQRAQEDARSGKLFRPVKI